MFVCFAVKPPRVSPRLGNTHLFRIRLDTDLEGAEASPAPVEAEPGGLVVDEPLVLHDLGNPASRNLRELCRSVGPVEWHYPALGRHGYLLPVIPLRNPHAASVRSPPGRGADQEEGCATTTLAPVTPSPCSQRGVGVV